MNTPTTRTTTGSPFGGALTAGIISLIVNLIVAYAISMIFPTLDLGWALTLVAITSLFAGFFGYYGAYRQTHTL
ncbi:MAG: hypothetical protein NT075_20360 [Chloroflexi bacterium]|nr:hypothetical protein [Chloroflexota bacterium]